MAAVDYFLKIDTIKGESKDKQHTDEIHLESWSFGESNTGTFATGGGGGAGKVHMQDFHFVKAIDKAGPQLFGACATGKHIPTAVLTCRKAGGTQMEFVKVTFSDVLISSYNTSGSGGVDVLPTEEISLNFAKVKFEYQEQKADGTPLGWIKSEFDLKRMEAAA